MVKEMICVHCNARLKFEGSVQSDRERDEKITCPVCGTINEVRWPVFIGVCTASVVRQKNPDANQGLKYPDT